MSVKLKYPFRSLPSPPTVLATTLCVLMRVGLGGSLSGGKVLEALSCVLFLFEERSKQE